MAVAEWMWTDSDVMGAGLGRMNRMLWSSRKSLEDTMSDLRIVSSQNLDRPVSLKMRFKGITLKQDFENANTAFLGLCAIQEMWMEDKENLTDAVVIQCASRTYAGFFDADANACITMVRWMWHDAGLSSVVPTYGTFAKKNPWRWSEWSSAASVVETLEAAAKGMAEARPVKLEVSGITRAGTPVLMEVRCSIVQEAVDVLLELVTAQCESGMTRGTARKSTHKSRASSVDEVFFFPLELEQAVEDAEQALRNAERQIQKDMAEKQAAELAQHQKIQKDMAEKQAAELAQHQKNADLAEMLDRKTRQRKVRTEVLAEVARNLQADDVEQLPSVDRSRKRCKSLGEALESAVQQRARRMRQA